MFKLLSTGNPKTLKGTEQGYMTYVLHLSPSDVSGAGNTCPKATPGCRSACLNTAGRGGMFPPGGTNIVQQARIRKTQMFFANRDEFMKLLISDIHAAIRQCSKTGYIPVFRLNATSDLSWERYTVDNKNIFETFPQVQFYDYTKVLGRKVSQYSNYHLTFSRADGNDADVEKAIIQGYNIAVVFDQVPDTFIGKPVHNADEDDLRFLDPRDSIAGLKAKGRAKKDYSGFVVRLKAVV